MLMNYPLQRFIAGFVESIHRTLHPISDQHHPEKKIVELAVKAKENKITVGDLQGGTFTITNGGTFGSMLSTPILNPPQSGILGMHAIQKRAVVVDDQIVIRPMMYIALSYDHRIIDGKEAVSFLVRVKECLENPERIFFSV